MRSGSTTSMATSTEPARSRPTVRPTPASSPRRKTLSAYRSERPSLRLCAGADHAPASEVRVPQPLGAGQARGIAGYGADGTG